jgi:hypothetical protein
MSVFTSTDELQLVMSDLWQEIKGTPDICDKLLASSLIVQFRYREPEGLITINCGDGQDMRIHVGSTEVKPHIEMSMKADVAHEFWLGKVNVPVALMMGKIVSRGPTPRALALLPALKPAYKLYPKVLKVRGKNFPVAAG